MALLRLSLIQCKKEDMTRGDVLGVIEISEKGFGKLRAANDQIYWDCTRWNVQPGDIWVDGVYYKAADPSTPVEYIPSTEEQLAEAQANLAEQAAYMDALLGIKEEVK